MQNRKRAIVTAVVAASVFATSLLPANAATVVLGRVIADGVRFRKEGHEYATVLGLMYKGESVSYYIDVFGEDPEFNYMYRNKTNQHGYVRHEFISY